MSDRSDAPKSPPEGSYHGDKGVLVDNQLHHVAAPATAQGTVVVGQDGAEFRPDLDRADYTDLVCACGDEFGSLRDAKHHLRQAAQAAEGDE